MPSRIRTRGLLAVLLAALLCLTVTSVALAEDYPTPGFGVNSFRYQGGEPLPADQIESVAPVDAEEFDGDEDDALNAMAGFVMWKKNSKGQYVSSNGKVIQGALRRGVDVSEWNGTIDWAKAQKDDISFAILRCGGTYMESRTQYSDDEFLRNAQECERLGIPYGVYFFSTALNVADAKKEAAFTLKAIKGLHPTMPIYYDLEWEDVASTSNRKMLADISTVFCETIAAAGYEPGIYASLSWWENYLTDPCFDNWTKWVAQYYSSCEYTGSYDIWQCTSVASVSGFSGSVDLNFDFRGDWGTSGAWKKNSTGWRYRYDDGSYASGSLVNIGGAIYTFDSNKYALTGWQKVDGQWYYFDPSTRAMQRGWLNLDGKWYWLDATTGVMTTGWETINGTWYYFDASNGVMKDAEVFKVGNKSYIAKSGGACPASSWVQLDGDWYLTNSSCALRSGFATVSGVKYYFDPNTYIMKTSETFKVDGTIYTASASGSVSKGGSAADIVPEGWVQSGSRWWYRLSNGSYPTSQRKNIGGTWYYFDANGWMATGWQKISGKWYYFESSGAMKTNGWVNGTYYMGSDGAMLVSTTTPDGYQVGADGAWISTQNAGWLQSGSKWWYRNSDGSYPASTWKSISGAWYWFDASGWMVTGWQKISGTWYYFESSGAMATGWQKIDGTWYWFDASGAMATGWREISGKWYYFESSGAMKANGWVNGTYYMGSDGAMLVSTTTPDGYKVDANGAWIR